MSDEATTIIKEPMPCNVKDWTLCILGVLIVLGFFATNLMIFLFPHDPNNVTINTILNYTNSLVVFVAGYYFGSSKSGDDKNKTISDMAALKDPQPAQTVNLKGPIDTVNNNPAAPPATS